MSLFKISKKADYALALLARLAEQEKGVRLSLADMEELGMPKSFMAKIGKNLVKAGILESREGKNGGYSLTKEPAETMVLEALKAVEGEVLPVNCSSCGVNEKCNQKGFMENLADELEELLSGYTLVDLLE